MKTFYSVLGTLLVFATTLSVETAAQNFNDAVMGYLYANRTAPPPTYVPEAIYNASSGSAQVDHLGSGEFDVTLFGLGPLADGGIVLVSPSANTLHSCSVDSWGSDGGNFVAGVRCFEYRFGTPAPTQFNLLFLNATSPNIPGLAYAWAFDSSSSSYDASGANAYNAGGGAIIAGRTGVGEYSMSFGGITATSRGHVQVSTYGTLGALCRVAGWTGDTISVNCHDVNGDPVDSQYTVLYLETDSPVEGLGYAWADQPTMSTYAPNPVYAYNGAGGGIEVMRLTSGANPIGYSIEFESLGSNCCTLAGHVQVSTYGADPNLCVVASGWTSWLRDFTAPLHCFSPGGQTADSEYGVLVVFPDRTPTTTEPDTELPTTLKLHAAFPNPFNPSTILRYDVTKSGQARISVYDILGREVVEIVNEGHVPGTYEVRFESAGLPTGAYILTLESGGETRTQIAILVR